MSEARVVSAFARVMVVLIASISFPSPIDNNDLPAISFMVFGNIFGDVGIVVDDVRAAIESARQIRIDPESIYTADRSDVLHPSISVPAPGSDLGRMPEE